MKPTVFKDAARIDTAPRRAQEFFYDLAIMVEDNVILDTETQTNILEYLQTMVRPKLPAVRQFGKIRSPSLDRHAEVNNNRPVVDSVRSPVSNSSPTSTKVDNGGYGLPVDVNTAFYCHHDTQEFEEAFPHIDRSSYRKRKFAKEHDNGIKKARQASSSPEDYRSPVLVTPSPAPTVPNSPVGVTFLDTPEVFSPPGFRTTPTVPNTPVGFTSSSSSSTVPNTPTPTADSHMKLPAADRFTRSRSPSVSIKEESFSEADLDELSNLDPEPSNTKAGSSTPIANEDSGIALDSTPSTKKPSTKPSKKHSKKQSKRRPTPTPLLSDSAYHTQSESSQDPAVKPEPSPDSKAGSDVVTAPLRRRKPSRSAAAGPARRSSRLKQRSSGSSVDGHSDVGKAKTEA